MTGRSIRFRLTAWYSGILAAALIGFGSASWLAVRHILFHTVDEELRGRVEGVRLFMEHQIGALSIEEIRDEFKEHSVLGPGGDLFQVCDAEGVWLYRSAALEEGGVSIRTPAALPPAGVMESGAVRGVGLRFLSRRVEVLGRPYTVQVAAPTDEMEEALSGFGWVLVVLAPAVLLVAAGGGWWMSRRALAPVDQITEAARAVGEQNLGRRLPVPPAQDELRRLSETLNEMLARIESAFRRVTEFTADASHELRTPVALIRTTAELALRKTRGPEEYRQALDEVHAESVRTTELIENLLTLARADAGKASLERRRLDLVGLVREVERQGEKLAGARSLEFQAELPEHAVEVVGDAAALRRVLLIILDNAAKYTPAGGISLRVTNHGAEAAVEVSDTGVGVSESELPRIFERFYRAEKSRSRDSGGAGLGLSIARWIVEAHGGSIDVRSKPQQGSTFTIRLPQAGAP
jgi:heavy metal sensor kinase